MFLQQMLGLAQARATVHARTRVSLPPFFWNSNCMFITVLVGISFHSSLSLKKREKWNI